MSSRSDFVHEIIGELRQYNSQPVVGLPTDIDMVWGLSAPGTMLETANDGVYSGISFDRQVVDHSIKVVRHATAVKLGIEVENVTREDIATNGPTFFYNGEDANTNRGKYLQNEHLEEWMRENGYPLPMSRVVIDSIPDISTPVQVKGLAEYLKEQPYKIGKIAVVSLAPHSVRVGRYIEKYKDLFPEGVTWLNAPAPQPHHSVVTTFRELHKILEYAGKGHLAHNSIFVGETAIKV